MNPATEQVLNEYEIITKDQLNNSINKARQAFLEWKNNVDRRTDFLYAFAKELRKNKVLQEPSQGLNYSQVEKESMVKDFSSVQQFSRMFLPKWK